MSHYLFIYLFISGIQFIEKKETGQKVGAESQSTAEK